MANRPKLFFVFPYRGVGGVSLLFLRLAEELARTDRADCVLVDYPDGFMARHRDPALTALAAYADDGAVDIPADAVAIFQSMTPWSIFPGLRPHSDTRLLFWNCHPYNLVPTLPGVRAAVQASRRLTALSLATVLRSYRARMRRFASLLLAKQSLVFMDRENVETTARFLGLTIPAPRMLPVGALEAPRRSVPTRSADGALHIAWVGRLVDFKFPILERSLREIDRWAGKSGDVVSMTIVGTGAFANRLRRLADAMRIQLSLIDHLSPERVDALLRNDVDLLLAMGTSALEGAKFGVPTILLDFAYGPVPSAYTFQWLADRDGSTLGDHVDARHLSCGAGSLDRRLAELAADSDGISRRTHSYFRAHHAIPAIAERLAAMAVTAQCRWRDLEAAGLLRKGLVYKLFQTMKRGLASS